MLYKKYYAYGMSVCLRYSDSKEDAVELLNDSFLKVFQNIKKFKQGSIFKPWFRIILIRTCVDSYRKKKIEEKILSSDEYDNIPVELDESLETEELLIIMNNIPEQYRTVFNLYEIEGYKHKEIGEMLEIKESSSRAFLTRAKNLLRKEYNKHYVCKKSLIRN